MDTHQVQTGRSSLSGQTARMYAPLSQHCEGMIHTNIHTYIYKLAFSVISTGTYGAFLSFFCFAFSAAVFASRSCKISAFTPERPSLSTFPARIAGRAAESNKKAKRTALMTSTTDSCSLNNFRKCYYLLYVFSIHECMYV